MTLETHKDIVRQLTGRCICGAIQYRLTSRPMFTHACHCRWCQRLSGGAFAINALIEADRVELVEGHPEMVRIDSPSRAGQDIACCPNCRVALWSHYLRLGMTVYFVRAGTLDDPDKITPDLHVFTSSKQPWLTLPDGAASVPELYPRKDYWPPDSYARLVAATGLESP